MEGALQDVQLWAPGRAGYVRLGLPISKGFFILELVLALRFWIDSTCGVTLGTLAMASSEKSERRAVLQSEGDHWFRWAL